MERGRQGKEIKLGYGIIGRMSSDATAVTASAARNPWKMFARARFPLVFYAPESVWLNFDAFDLISLGFDALWWRRSLPVPFPRLLIQLRFAFDSHWPEVDRICRRHSCVLMVADCEIAEAVVSVSLAVRSAGKRRIPNDRLRRCWIDFSSFIWFVHHSFLFLDPSARHLELIASVSTESNSARLLRSNSWIQIEPIRFESIRAGLIDFVSSFSFKTPAGIPFCWNRSSLDLLDKIRISPFGLSRRWLIRIVRFQSAASTRICFRCWIGFGCLDSFGLRWIHLFDSIQIDRVGCVGIDRIYLRFKFICFPPRSHPPHLISIDSAWIPPLIVIVIIILF